MTVDCHAFEEFLQQKLDGAAPPEETEPTQHLDSCPHCPAIHDAWSRLERGVRLLRPAPLPVGMAARIVAAVQAERFQAQRRKRRIMAAVAVAASVGVAVSLWFYRQPFPPPLPVQESKTAKINEKDSPPPAIGTPRQSVETAVEAVASLTTEKTASTMAQTRQLLPLVEPVLPDLSVEPMIPQTALSSFREARHGASEAVESVTDHAKRFAGMVRRDLLPEF